MKISIILPIYNGSKYLLECLESCVNQTFNKNDYEIICCDDCSTDNSLEILNEFKNKYSDYNINIISKIHTGIADTLNECLKQSKGHYICTMNQDDVNYNNRLEVQYNILEENKNIDVLSCGFDSIGTGNGFYPSKYQVTLELMKKNNFVSNPSSMYRKSILDKIPFWYEQYYSPADDYKFWCTCLMYGINIWNYPNVVLKYRLNESSATHSNKMQICSNRIKNLYNNQDYQNDRDLSVILTFNNEGIEVEKTVQSIFSTTKHTNIILVNDASDDNYDYEGLTKKYNNVIYIYNKIRQGVAESRNIGVRNSSTEYCVLLDAHMRFYDDNWDVKIIDLLKKYNNSILCSHTVVIKKNLCDYYINEDDTNNHIISYGANINLDHTKERCFRHKWNYVKLESNEDNLIEIPSVLGACYCFTKSHWNYIHGLNGLIKYGLDEALMSMKTWMMGGKCYLINDFWVGHLYRDSLPYQVSQSDVAFNEYFCIKLFIPENNQEKYIKNLYNRLNDTSKKELDEYIKKYINVIKIEKNYFNNYKKHNFEWFINFNDIKAS